MRSNTALFVVICCFAATPAFAQTAGVLFVETPELSEPSDEQSALLARLADTVRLTAIEHGSWEQVVSYEGGLDTGCGSELSCLQGIADSEGYSAVWSSSLTGEPGAYSFELRLFLAGDTWFAAKETIELGGEEPQIAQELPTLVQGMIAKVPLLGAAALEDDGSWKRDRGDEKLFGFDDSSGATDEDDAATSGDSDDDEDDYDPLGGRVQADYDNTADDGAEDDSDDTDDDDHDPRMNVDADDTDYGDGDQTDYDAPEHDEDPGQERNSERQSQTEQPTGPSAAERRAERKADRQARRDLRGSQERVVRRARPLEGMASIVQLRGRGGYTNYYMMGHGGHFALDVGAQIHEVFAPMFSIGGWSFPWNVSPDRTTTEWETISNVPISIGLMAGYPKGRLRPFGGIDLLMVIYSGKAQGEGTNRVAAGPRFRAGADIMFTERVGAFVQLGWGFTESKEPVILNYRSLELIGFDENHEAILRGPLPNRGGFFASSLGLVFKL